MAKKRKAAKAAAVVTIHRAAGMSPHGRRQIAACLRRHAKMLEKEGPNYANLFRGRYYYG